MLKEFLWPDKRKVLLGIILAAFFSFFPLVSKGVFAVPFLSFASDLLSAALNLGAAYVFACFLVTNAGNRKRLAVAALVLVLVYLLVPKVASYWVGDLGGTTETYCNCVGAKFSTSTCCGSGVDYCIGVCQRDEKTERWRGWG